VYVGSNKEEFKKKEIPSSNPSGWNFGRKEEPDLPRKRGKKI
jgi:hypothetical protein